MSRGKSIPELMADADIREASALRRVALTLAVECMKPHTTPGAPGRVVDCAKEFEAYLRGAQNLLDKRP